MTCTCAFDYVHYILNHLNHMCMYVCMYVYMYICVCLCVCLCVCVCVCVDHLYRCKTSLRYLSGFVMVHDFLFHAGGSGRSFGTATNEDTHLIWWYRLGRQSAYLHQFSFPSMATGQAKNRHVDLFSISFLHSCHNLPILRLLWLTKLHQNIPPSKDVESILRTEVHVESSNFSCQV